MRTHFSSFVLRMALAVLLLAVPGLAFADSSSTISVKPAKIDMGAQFNGVDLVATGQVPAGSDVVVRLVGTPSQLHLREKGKVFGLLWMNVGKVTVDNVPGVCLIDATKPLQDLGAGAEPMRLEAVTGAIKVSREGGDDSINIPHELLLLKSKEKLYNETDGGITLAAAKDGMQQFTAHIKVPSSLKPGTYKVEVTALQQGQVAGSAATSLSAALVGFPLWLMNLALHRAVLYGVMATVIAIVAGLVIGLLFQSKEAH